MPTFAPGPDEDFSDTLKLVSQLQRTVNSLIAQALPKPNPALQVQRALGQVLAQQINQRTALSASLAVNRLAAMQRLATANANARLPEIVSSSFSPLVEVQARVARDALLGNQWQRTMLSLYPALRAREALENISRLTRSLGNVYYPPHPGAGPYQSRTIPEGPGPTEIEPADTATSTEGAEHLRDALEEYVSALVDFYKQVSKLAEDHPVQALILFDILCRLIFMDRS
jgi:hypothetical protein